MKLDAGIDMFGGVGEGSYFICKDICFSIKEDVVSTKK